MLLMSSLCLIFGPGWTLLTWTEALAWLWSLVDAVSGFGQSYMFYEELGMIRIATGCESDSIQTAGGSMAGKNNSTRGSEEVCHMGSRSHDSWPSGLKEEGQRVGWAFGLMLEEGWWRLLVSHQGESQKSSQKGLHSGSQTQGQTERARPWKWKEQVDIGLDVWQSQAMLWAGDDGTVEGRPESGLPSQGEKRQLANFLFPSLPFSFPKGIWAGGIEKTKKHEETGARNGK